MTSYPYMTPALQVVQPIGTFYVCVLPANLLLQVAESDVMTATLNPDGVGYTLKGTQRVRKDNRLTQIADYINRMDAAFPNSIILAANHNRDLGLDEDEIEAINLESSEQEKMLQEHSVPPVSKSWWISDEGSSLALNIPSPQKLAAIIDGQHRLFAFAKANRHTRLDMELICAIFLDLPKPYQAQLFATINSTQKPVDRSLTFELFGYNVSDEAEQMWTPDKLAVFMTRKLSTESDSPLKGRIAIAPKRDVGLLAVSGQAEWRVSTAVIVDGILRLFSSNPRRDVNAMRTPTALDRTALRDGANDRSPLRKEFIACNDTLIYQIAQNYLTACSNLFWKDVRTESYIIKTVGVQALFDILRKLAPRVILDRDLRISYFENILKPASDINFAEQRFQVPAGSGRSAIRRAIEEHIEIDTI